MRYDSINKLIVLLNVQILFQSNFNYNFYLIFILLIVRTVFALIVFTYLKESRIK